MSLTKKTTLTACYWGNSSDDAIGKQNNVTANTGSCTKVTGEGESTWIKAMEAMNAAIKEASYSWEYELNTDTDSNEKLKFKAPTE